MTALVLCLASGAMACGGVKPTVNVSGDPKAEAAFANIAEVLAADKDGRFTTLLACAQLTGAGAAITGTGPVTLFAPTNSAFAKAGVSCSKDSNSKDSKLSESQSAALLRTLAQHVTDTDVRFSPPANYDAKKPPLGLELVNTRPVTVDSILLDAAGTALVVTPDKSVSTVDAPTKKAKVIEADIQAPNGIIQVIDVVLIPPSKPAYPPTTIPPKPFE